ncbi:MAG TPA: hypothetical protein VMK12_08340, partial [Anaeromyxobacteraceae bacterium]|nr:hypothetical protein [Anaeromyxobacteraceae bacterium]
MKDTKLAAVAICETWRFPEPHPGGAWQTLLEELVSTVALECEAAGVTVIGHVKALAVWPRGGYVRVSAVDTTHQPTAESTAAAPAAAVELTLNVLIYGLAEEAVARVAGGSLRRVAITAGAQVIPCSAPVGG